MIKNRTFGNPTVVRSSKTLGPQNTVVSRRAAILAPSVEGGGGGGCPAPHILWYILSGARTMFLYQNLGENTPCYSLTSSRVRLQVSFLRRFNLQGGEGFQLCSLSARMEWMLCFYGSFGVPFFFVVVVPTSLADREVNLRFLNGVLSRGHGAGEEETCLKENPVLPHSLLPSITSLTSPVGFSVCDGTSYCNHDYGLVAVPRYTTPHHQASSGDITTGTSLFGSGTYPKTGETSLTHVLNDNPPQAMVYICGRCKESARVLPERWQSFSPGHASTGVQTYKGPARIPRNGGDDML